MAAKVSAPVAHVLTFSLHTQMKADSTANHCEMQTCQAWICDYLPWMSFILQPHLCSTYIKHPPTVSFPSTAGNLYTAVNPYLTRGLTDVAQDKAVKLATGKQTALVKVKQVTFCGLPSLCLYIDKCGCVYLTAIPTCSDAAHWNHQSQSHQWYFLTYSLLCLIPLKAPFQLI